MSKLLLLIFLIPLIGYSQEYRVAPTPKEDVDTLQQLLELQKEINSEIEQIKDLVRKQYFGGEKGDILFTLDGKYFILKQDSPDMPDGFLVQPDIDYTGRINNTDIKLK